MDIYGKAFRFRMEPRYNAASHKRKEAQEPHAPGKQMKIRHRPIDLEIRYGKRNTLRKAINIQRAEKILLEPPRLE